NARWSESERAIHSKTEEVHDQVRGPSGYQQQSDHQGKNARPLTLEVDDAGTGQRVSERSKTRAFEKHKVSDPDGRPTRHDRDAERSRVRPRVNEKER